MSIIYDALKKLEQATYRKESKLKTDRNPRLNLKRLLLYALVAIFGFFIANSVFDIFAKRSKVDQELALSVTPEVIEEKPVAVTPSPPKSVPQSAQQQPKPSLVLSGVFFSDNEGYALINNRIVKVGDEIEGATVSQITLGAVELKFQDSTIELHNR